MKSKFTIRITDIREIDELLDAWKQEDFLQLLALADFEDADQLDPSELKDYTLLTLQDHPPDEAAEIVLKYLFQDRLKVGQIQNMAHEMMEEKLWEEYSDILLHHELYNAAVLMKWAFPRKFPETDAFECRVAVSADHTAGKDLLKQANRRLLARILARGMDEHSLINRLFDDQVGGTPFPEADGIIWDFRSEEVDNEQVFTVHSSNYWFQDLNESPTEYTSSHGPEDLN